MMPNQQHSNNMGMPNNNQFSQQVNNTNQPNQAAIQLMHRQMKMQQQQIHEQQQRQLHQQQNNNNMQFGGGQLMNNNTNNNSAAVQMQQMLANQLQHQRQLSGNNNNNNGMQLQQQHQLQQQVNNNHQNQMMNNNLQQQSSHNNNIQPSQQQQDQDPENETTAAFDWESGLDNVMNLEPEPSNIHNNDGTGMMGSALQQQNSQNVVNNAMGMNNQPQSIDLTMNNGIGQSVHSHQLLQQNNDALIQQLQMRLKQNQQNSTSQIHNVAQRQQLQQSHLQGGMVGGRGSVQQQQQQQMNQHPSQQQVFGLSPLGGQSQQQQIPNQQQFQQQFPPALQGSTMQQAQQETGSYGLQQAAGNNSTNNLGLGTTNLTRQSNIPQSNIPYPQVMQDHTGNQQQQLNPQSINQNNPHILNQGAATMNNTNNRAPSVLSQGSSPSRPGSVHRRQSSNGSRASTSTNPPLPIQNQQVIDAMRRMSSASQLSNAANNNNNPQQQPQQVVTTQAQHIQQLKHQQQAMLERMLQEQAKNKNNTAARGLISSVPMNQQAAPSKKQPDLQTLEKEAAKRGLLGANYRPKSKHGKTTTSQNKSTKKNNNQGDKKKQDEKNTTKAQPPIVNLPQQSESKKDSTAKTSPPHKDASAVATTNNGEAPSSTKEEVRCDSSQGSLFSQEESVSLPTEAEPNPIADDVNVMHNASGAILVRSSGPSTGGTTEGLDGHFAGGWQSNSDLAERRRMNFHIIKVIERMRPDVNNMSRNQLPLTAKKFEEHLYRNAHTKEEYKDPASLKRRLSTIAKGMANPGEEGDGVDGTSSVTGSASLKSGQSGGQSSTTSKTSNRDPSKKNNKQVVPMEAVSRGPSNGSANSSNNMSNQQRNQQQHQKNKARSTDDNSSIGAASGLSQESFGGGDQDTKRNLLQQQRRLLLLRHASKCDIGPTCKTKGCPQMVTLWKHMKECRENKCTVRHCVSSRCVLNHYRICKSEGKTESCAMCGPVLEYVRKKGDKSTDDLDTLLVLDNEEKLASTTVLGDLDSTISDVRSSQEKKPSDIEIDNEPLNVLAGEQGNSSSPKPGHRRPSDLLQIENNEPQNEDAVTMPVNVTDLQQDIERKETLLQSVRGQKASLFSQSQKLKRLLEMSSNPEEAQRLQEQQQTVERMNQQFVNQEIMLQEEIRNLQEQGNTKRSDIPNAQESQRPSKIARVGDDQQAPDMNIESFAIGSSDLLEQPLGEEDFQIFDIDSTSTGQLAPEYIVAHCLPLVTKLIAHEHGWVFRDAVDPIELGIPEYHEIVEHPMDLNLVKNKLEDGVYKDIASFEKDARLVFENAMLFNGEDSDVGRMAKELLDIFNEDAAKAKSALH